MKNTHLALLALAVLAIGIFLTGCAPQQENMPVVPNSGVPTSGDLADEDSLVHNAKEPPAPSVKEFHITAIQFSFDPDTITVMQGDTVRLHVVSTDVAHGFSLPAFGIDERLDPGKTVVIEFVADKTGTFPFECSVFCGSGHNEMQGQLIVQ